MQLKGRIFMQNVTDIIKASKSGRLPLSLLVFLLDPIIA